MDAGHIGLWFAIMSIQIDTRWSHQDRWNNKKVVWLWWGKYSNGRKIMVIFEFKDRSSYQNSI